VAISLSAGRRSVVATVTVRLDAPMRRIVVQWGDGAVNTLRKTPGVEAAVDPKQTKISITGIDRQQVGQVAAEMRSLRPPDPYKNKGVRYAGERLKKKVGKTGAK